MYRRHTVCQTVNKTCKQNAPCALEARSNSYDQVLDGLFPLKSIKHLVLKICYNLSIHSIYGNTSTVTECFMSFQSLEMCILI